MLHNLPADSTSGGGGDGVGGSSQLNVLLSKNSFISARGRLSIMSEYPRFSFLNPLYLIFLLKQLFFVVVEWFQLSNCETSGVTNGQEVTVRADERSCLKVGRRVMLGSSWFC